MKKWENSEIRYLGVVKNTDQNYREIAEQK